jgi:hypothetical protein
MLGRLKAFAIFIHIYCNLLLLKTTEQQPLSTPLCYQYFNLLAPEFGI